MKFIEANGMLFNVKELTLLSVIKKTFILRSKFQDLPVSKYGLSMKKRI